MHNAIFECFITTSRHFFSPKFEHRKLFIISHVTFKKHMVAFIGKVSYSPQWWRRDVGNILGIYYESLWSNMGLNVHFIDAKPTNFLIHNCTFLHGLHVYISYMGLMWSLLFNWALEFKWYVAGLNIKNEHLKDMWIIIDLIVRERELWFLVTQHVNSDSKFPSY